MELKTIYNVGDTIIVDGKKETIISCHLYVSENKHTERYYLGNKKWITLTQTEENK